MNNQHDPFADLPLPEEPTLFDDEVPPPADELPPEGYESVLANMHSDSSQPAPQPSQPHHTPSQSRRNAGTVAGETGRHKEKLLEGLNPQQRQAVEHMGSPLLIVAGAGSGKTRVLPRRIAYLLANGVAPWQILAITFTNKAAAEMRERVVHMVGSQAERMWVSTFHSFCVRVLRANAHLAPGLNTNFSIYDSDDSKRLMTMIIKDASLDLKEFAPRGVLHVLSLIHI